MSHWTEEYATMCEDCEKRESKLNEWEAGFIDSVSKQITDKQSISEKQIEILNRIWERVTAKG